MDVAQLVEWLLPTPKICSSHPDIGKLLSTNCTFNQKEAGNGPSFKKVFLLQKCLRTQDERKRKKLDQLLKNSGGATNFVFLHFIVLIIFHLKVETELDDNCQHWWNKILLEKKILLRVFESSRSEFFFHNPFFIVRGFRSCLQLPSLNWLNETGCYIKSLFNYKCF